MNCQRLDIATVRAAARGRWQHILSALGICVPANPRKHAPCPSCGGRDRFRFDDRDGAGSWFCNRCTPQAGDGLALVMNARHASFREALLAVGGVLGLDHTAQTRPRLPLPPVPQRVDRRAIAFRFEMGALDRRLRAERVLTAVSSMTDLDVPDDLRERLMASVASAYADLARADLLEQVADGLRVKDSHRKTMNR